MGPEKMSFTRVNDSLEEIIIDVTFTYSPPVPGRYSGPPDRCYPDEPGEVEIHSARIRESGEHVELTDGEIDQVYAEADRLYAEHVADCYEPDDDKDIADYWRL